MSYVNVFCYNIDADKVEALAKAIEVEVSYVDDEEEHLPVLEVETASDVLALCYAFKPAVKFDADFLDIYFDKLGTVELQKGMEYLGVEL